MVDAHLKIFMLLLKVVTDVNAYLFQNSNLTVVTGVDAHVFRNQNLIVVTDVGAHLFLNFDEFKCVDVCTPFFLKTPQMVNPNLIHITNVPFESVFCQLCWVLNEYNVDFAVF